MKNIEEIIINQAKRIARQNLLIIALKQTIAELQEFIVNDAIMDAKRTNEIAELNMAFDKPAKEI